MQSERPHRIQAFVPALCCALLYAAAVLASRPFVELGIEDDWSYVRSAQVLAQTGHIVYNGWATAMLGPQLYLGALAFKLFGFSFTAARASVLLTGMLTTVLLQRVLVRFGLHRFNATAATLLIMLAPIMQPLSFTFHTDVPGLLCIVAALYCCQRAIAAQSPRAVVLWLALGSVCGIMGGSIRQIAWLSALVMVPSAAWLRRRDRGVLAAATALWAFSFAAVLSILHWFNAQPYSVPEHLKTDAWRTVPDHLAIWGGGLVLGFPLFVLPFLIAMAVRFPYRSHRLLVAVFAISAIAIPLVTMHRLQFGLPWLEPYAVNVLSPRGVFDCSPMLSERPPVLGRGIRVVLTFVCLFAALVTLEMCAAFRRTAAFQQTGRAWTQRLVLLGPFSLAYLALLLPRASFGVAADRYLLPLIVLAGMCLTQLYQDWFHANLPRLAIATGVVLSLAGVVAMHNLFGFERARLSATQELRNAGVPRQQIGGGFEYDGWTQITTVGTMSDGRIQVPRGIHYYQPAWMSGPCHNNTEAMLSAVHPLYYLSLDPTLCHEASQFPSVEYRPWLARKPITIYILKADQPYDWQTDPSSSAAGK